MAGAEVKVLEQAKSGRAVGEDAENGVKVKERSKEEVVAEDEETVVTTLDSRLDHQVALEDSTEVTMLIYDTLGAQNSHFEER